MTTVVDPKARTLLLGYLLARPQHTAERPRLIGHYATAWVDARRTSAWDNEEVLEAFAHGEQWARRAIVEAEFLGLLVRRRADDGGELITLTSSGRAAAQASP